MNKMLSVVQFYSFGPRCNNIKMDLLQYTEVQHTQIDDRWPELYDVSLQAKGKKDEFGFFLGRSVAGIADKIIRTLMYLQVGQLYL